MQKAALTPGLVIGPKVSRLPAQQLSAGAQWHEYRALNVAMFERDERGLTTAKHQAAGFFDLESSFRPSGVTASSSCARLEHEEHVLRRYRAYAGTVRHIGMPTAEPTAVVSKTRCRLRRHETEFGDTNATQALHDQRTTRQIKTRSDCWSEYFDRLQLGACRCRRPPGSQ